MSSMLAAGPPISLAGPLPEPPPHSLLQVPGVLVDSPQHGLNGGVVEAYPQGVPRTWEPCSSGTDRTKEAGDELLTPMFGPIGVYLPISCSSMGIGEYERFRDRAEKALEATESFAVERLLSQGVVNSNNPFFTDVNFDVLAMGVSPEIGLAYLEQELALVTARQGLIHATPAVASRWGTDKLVERDGGLFTINGTPVAVGGGYIGAVGPPAGQDYAFVTGPVEVYHTDGVDLTLADVLDRETNDVTYRAERYVVAAWDTALQAGVLIDWAT